MKDNIKSEKAYKTIGEVAKDLGLINNKNGNLNTHTIRFWEKQFTQIKPTIKAGGRRYYSYADFEIIKLVKYLLKDKGLTIRGVKKLLKGKKVNQLDDYELLGVNRSDIKGTEEIKNKINKILKLIKELKKLKNG